MDNRQASQLVRKLRKEIRELKQDNDAWTEEHTHQRQENQKLVDENKQLRFERDYPSLPVEDVLLGLGRLAEAAARTVETAVRSQEAYRTGKEKR